MKHLFLGLNTKGYGETALGVRLAEDLRRSGDTCVFLANEAAAPMLADTGFVHVKTVAHSASLLQFSILAVINKFEPDSIVMSDYYTSTVALRRAGLDVSCLSQFGRPIVAIDTWDMRRSGIAIDIFGDEEHEVPDWLDAVTSRVIPVPIANSVYDGPYYNCLPGPVELPAKVRRHIRRDFGLTEQARVMLFCTAQWQHADYPREDGNRIKRGIPQLLARYVSQLGPDVHVIHVGPSRLPMDLDGRYHWVPPLDTNRFDMLLASVDLLVASNASAATVAKALVSSVPSVALVNSYSVQSAAEYEASVPGDPSPQVLDWLKESAPVYPFSMWPVGYYRFLKVLFDGNRYCDAVPMLEVLEANRATATLSDLLFSASARTALIASQQAYIDEVRRLPSGATLLQESLRQAHAS